MAKQKKVKRDFGGMVYSTNPDYDFNDHIEEEDTLPNSEQQLIVRIDRSQRKGKEVTLIQKFIGKESDLQDLGKQLKQFCGVGGSVKDGEIILQGDLREKAVQFLLKKDYKAKKGN